MEENVLLSNIATILVKDILIDELNNSSKQPPPPCNLSDTTCMAQYPLLETDDDEAFTFFLRQNKLLTSTKPKPTYSKTSKSPLKRTAELKIISKPHKKRPNTATENSPISSKECGKLELNLLNTLSITDFENHLHMSKMSFLKVFQSVRQFLLARDLPSAMPPQTVFSLALWKLATDEHFEQMGRKFRIPRDICQHAIRQFWHVISAHNQSFIQWPSTAQRQLYNMQNFRTISALRSFQQLFGVIALKQLDVFLANENAEMPIVLQIICDSDQKVIDCFLELATNYTFDATPIAQTLAMNTTILPAQSFLIGGKCFPLMPHLMRPFDAAKEQREIALNQMLQPAICMAQRVLDTMAKRFNALYALEAKDLHEVRKIVDTICALHNLCVEIEDDYVERKPEEMQFNWARADSELMSIRGSEANVQGKRRREELMMEIVSIN